MSERNAKRVDRYISCLLCEQLYDVQMNKVDIYVYQGTV